MRCLLITRRLIAASGCVASSVQLRRIGHTRAKLFSNDGTRSTILPAPTDTAVGSAGSGKSEAKSSSSLSFGGEDTRVCVKDPNRVLRTGDGSAAFADEAQAALLQEATAAPQRDSPSPEIRPLPHCKKQQNDSAAVSVAATASVGMTGDAKGADAAVSKASSDESDCAMGDADPSGVRVVVRDHMRCTIAVEPLQSFAQLARRLPLWLARGLYTGGFSSPTPVQSVAIPLFLQQRDVICVAPTGSGKTVAFAVPALAAAACSAPLPQTAAVASPRVLVLCPTRELVQQTFTVLAALAGGAVRVECLFGGQERERQRNALRARDGCDVLVSTPGRLCDFVEAGVVALRAVDFLVMDEADRMLELGFAPQLEFAIAAMRGAGRKWQTSMWTATWSATVGSLAARFMRAERVRVDVDSARGTNVNISQRLYAVADPTERIAAVARLYESGVIRKCEQTLFFVNRQSATEELAAELCRALRAPPDLVQALHGRMKQRRREAIVRGFREGEIRILCATDIAARGLDVPSIAHVVNYELPELTDVYVHRVGRTGRAGRAGTAHTFIVSGDGRAPRIARFVAEQSGEPLRDDVRDIVRAVELRGAAAPGRERFRSHTRLAGRDWRAPAHVSPTRATGSRHVRGIGRVVTLARPRRAAGGDPPQWGKAGDAR